MSDRTQSLFLDSWFKEIVHTNLSFKSVSVQKDADDNIRIDLSIVTSSEKLDGMGNGAETTFDGPLTRRFLDEDCSIIHELTIDATGPDMVVSVRLGRRPTSDVLDPNYR